MDIPDSVIEAIIQARTRDEAIRALAEAFEQGQKSGIRHATRLAAAFMIDRPDLPGPISPNPYRPIHED